MIRWGLLLLCLLPSLGRAASEPYAAESHVRDELESSLARMIPKAQFVVDVHTEVTIRSERKIVEAEALSSDTAPPAEIKVPPMPGFTAETKTETPPPPPPPKQSRETYRLVETPELTAVRVSVLLDSALPAPTLTRAKAFVQSYLQLGYPRISAAAFSIVPMVKPTFWEKIDSRDLMALLALLLFAITVLRLLSRPHYYPPPHREKAPAAERPGAELSARQTLSPPASDPFAWARALPGALISLPGARPELSPASIDPMGLASRKRLLDKFFAKADCFRLFYNKLSPEEQGDVHALLEGPAYESLLENYGITPPVGAPPAGTDVEEKILRFEKQFEEFAQAAEWKDRQLFGFLQKLSDEQIISLAQHQSEVAISVMMRFMKPNQTALVLSSLTRRKRQEVMSHVPVLKDMPLTEITAIEKEIRSYVQRLPNRAFGTAKEDTRFWGSVISEAEDQETLLDELEKTHPDIYPGLEKYRFKLEDAATLPDALLGKILRDVDNEELCTAIATCSSDVVEVIMDALPQKRRDVIGGLVDTYRTIPPERARAARSALTKRIREAMA